MLVSIRVQASTPAAGFPMPNWTVADPASQGMDAARLTAADQIIRSSMPHVHSLLVVRHGYLVWETYYGRYRQNTRHAVMSVTKSITSAVVGITIDRGILWFQGQVVTFLPEYFPAGIDGRKLSVQIQHLLSLRSGIDWAEYPPLSAESQQVVRLDYVMGLPMVASPGERFHYSTGDYQILAGILSRATGMSEQVFAHGALFAPLGISNYRWQAERNGISKGGVGLSMLPRDMAKFGLLYLSDGFWNGQQVVSSGWVAQSTALPPENKDAWGYAYGWWVLPMAGQRAYYAAGYGGQLIVVVPGLDLVVVMTGNENVSPPVQDANSSASLRFIENQIMPAVQ